MIWMRSPRCSRRLAMAVTDRGATLSWPSMATRTGGDKSWVLAMLAARRRLRVAPVPPQAAADLTPPARVARAMPGRGEGTGASIEPRNNHGQASRLAVNTTRRLQSLAQWWVRLNHASHTEIRILPDQSACICFLSAANTSFVTRSAAAGRWRIVLQGCAIDGAGSGRPGRTAILGALP